MDFGSLKNLILLGYILPPLVFILLTFVFPVIFRLFFVNKNNENSGAKGKICKDIIANFVRYRISILIVLTFLPVIIAIRLFPNEFFFIPLFPLLRFIILGDGGQLFDKEILLFGNFLPPLIWGILTFFSLKKLRIKRAFIHTLWILFIIIEISYFFVPTAWGPLVSQNQKIENKITNCENIKTLERRSNCYVNLAIAQNNPSMCWKVETASLSSSCWERFKMKEWHTYTNEELQFSFKYPLEWKIINNSLLGKGKQGGPGENLTITNDLVSEIPTFILYVNSLGWGLYSNDIKYELTLSENDKIIIERTVILSEEELGSDRYVDGKTIIYGKGKLKTNEYFFIFSFKEGGENYEPALKEMLSTFKFNQ